MNPFNLFQNPWMLSGAVLAAIPILIHLFNKSKFKVEAWGAMMFLGGAAESRSSRIRLEQIILMCLHNYSIMQ